MEKGRLEAFSDGVIAIIITIMVLEIKVPHGVEFSALKPLLPIFLSYVLSFLYVGIYWNNHHHLLKAAERVNGSIMWANLHLLFWLSLIPFSSGWLGENHFAAGPSLLYSSNLLLCAIAYFLLQQAILAEHGSDCELARAIGRDWKGKLSPLIYVVAIALACFGQSILATVLTAITGLIWLIPDRRIEKALAASAKKAPKH
jgi:uncharacterized membrane protein